MTAPEHQRHTVVTFSRVEQSGDCALAAARIIQRVNGKGLDVDLIVRGAPPEIVGRARRLLSSETGRAVDVRPYVVDRADIVADLAQADAVIMPVRPKGFGAVGLDAALEGVPLLVPITSGIGIFLADPSRYPAELVEHVLVEQDFDEPVPLDRWVGKLHALLTDLPRSRERAHTLKHHLREQNRTRDGATESLAAIDRAALAAANKEHIRYSAPGGDGDGRR